MMTDKTMEIDRALSRATQEERAAVRLATSDPVFRRMIEAEVGLIEHGHDADLNWHNEAFKQLRDDHPRLPAHLIPATFAIAKDAVILEHLDGQA